MKFHSLSRTSKTNSLLSLPFASHPPRLLIASCFPVTVMNSAKESRGQVAYCKAFGWHLKNTGHLNCIVHSAWLFPDQNAVQSLRLYKETPLNCRTWFRACSRCGIFTLGARRYSVRRLPSIFVHSSAKNMDKTTEDKHLQQQHWITRKTVNPRALKLQQTTQHPRKMGLNLLKYTLNINNTRTHLCQTLQQGEPFLVCDWLWFVSVHVQLLSCPP